MERETGRLTYADMCRALDEHRDITEAALALGFGGGDRKKARDHFQVAFKRAALPLGEETRAGQYLRARGVVVKTPGVRARLAGLAGKSTTYQLNEKAADALARAVARATALGAADASAAIADICAGYLAHVKNK